MAGYHLCRARRAQALDQRGRPSPRERHPDRVADCQRNVGLVPGEHSSGETRRQGAITKTGNSHVRRLLIEAAWNYRHRPHVGTALRNRRKGQSPRTIALADRAIHRLHRRYEQMSHRGVLPQKAVVAMARELAGFVWAALSPLAQHSPAH